jgi:hypothetical protein
VVFSASALLGYVFFGALNNASSARYFTLQGNFFIFSYKYSFQNCLPSADFAETAKSQ